MVGHFQTSNAMTAANKNIPLLIIELLLAPRLVQALVSITNVEHRLRIQRPVGQHPCGTAL